MFYSFQFGFNTLGFEVLLIFYVFLKFNKTKFFHSLHIRRSYYVSFFPLKTLDHFNRFDLRFDEFLCNKFVLNASLAVLLRSGSFSDATKTKGVKKKKKYSS